MKLRYLTTVLLVCSINLFAQALQPLQPSLLSGSLSTEYLKTFPIAKGFSLELHSGLGVHFSLYPPVWGAAPSVEARAEARYAFGKEPLLGFGVSLFTATDILWNPIFYEDERVEMDALWSITPGLMLFWRFEPQAKWVIEPYLAGQCRFFTSFHYDTGIVPYMSGDIGVRFMVSRKTFDSKREKVLVDK